MLKVNSYLNNPKNNCPNESIENTVVVESDYSGISADTMIVKEDNGNVYAETIIHDHCTCTNIRINTIIINNNSVVNCSQITATNNSNVSIQWALVNSLDNTIFYTTTKSYTKGEVCTIDLSSITTNINFKLRALVSHKTETSCVVLNYDPMCHQSANFVLKEVSSKTNICYLGTKTI